MTDATDARLAAQYEAYPYPARDPADEARRLVVGSPSHLREVDHWVFGAARPRSRPLRALVAGGGTGDGAIMLAQQMARPGGPARSPTWTAPPPPPPWRRRGRRARGLTLAWHEGSLLDLPGSGLGPFDYIDCCGVLHHLPDPAAGLAALLSVLAPGGGLGLMVYAPHGRTGVYELQDALRWLAPETEPPAARLDAARRMMRHLPESAWLRRNTLFADHLTGGDAGLYDLLLNPRDRAFTVPALHALLQAAGLARHLLDGADALRPGGLPAGRQAARAVAAARPGAAGRPGGGAVRQHEHPRGLRRARGGRARPSRTGWPGRGAGDAGDARRRSWPATSGPTARCRSCSTGCACRWRCRRWPRRSCA